MLYDLLRDLMVLRTTGGEIRNQDMRTELEALAGKASFAWIRQAVVGGRNGGVDPAQYSEDTSRSMR